MWSGFVRLMRIALPLAALALVLAVFLAPQDDIGFEFGDVEIDFSDGLRLDSPRFSGADSEGRPFSITAEWALPDKPDPERVALGPIEGETRLADGRGVTLRAGGGEILPKARRLELTGGVSVRTDDGWRLTAPRAEADLDAETLTADGPVAGAGPSGEIRAGAMRAARREDGDYIWFERGVRLRIDPQAARELPQGGQ